MRIILPLVCIIFYLGSALTQYFSLLERLRRSYWVVLLGWAAVLVHAWLLYSWIDLTLGQNLTFFNMLSFVIWLVCLWLLLGMMRQPLQNLCIFVFPIAAVSVLAAVLFPSYDVLPMAKNPKQLWHVLSAAAAFSVLGVAAVQAMLLRIQDSLLKHNYAGVITKKLPPLETMERLLFQMLGLGFVLLTLVLLSSMYFFNNLFKLPLLSKTILVFIIWCIFAVLLAGRYFFGWRGRKIVYYTFSGFFLLTIVYFVLSS